ncbi:MAG: hypothetical protein ABI670_03585 [Chloroflexota bacterium]
MNTNESNSDNGITNINADRGSKDTVQLPLVEGNTSNKGRSAKSSGKDSTGSGAEKITGQVQETAGQVIGQAQETAGKVVDQVRESASSQISTQKDRAAETIGTLAGAIRDTGTQLQEKDQGTLAEYTGKVADQIEQFSNYLQNKDMGDIVAEVERFARRQPAIFLGGAFALGMLGARFLKSSTPQAQPQYGDTSQNWSTQPYSAGYYSGQPSSRVGYYSGQQSTGTDYSSGRQGMSTGSYSEQASDGDGYSSGSTPTGYSSITEDAPLHGERDLESTDMEG